MIYHIALAEDWRLAQEAGEYRVSSLGVTLEEEGYLHMAFAEQVRGVADRYYAGVRDRLVLLGVDETMLASPWRVDPVPGSPTGFPHVYGPLDLGAVVTVWPLRRAADGSLDLPVG